jgi:hypothetical protein
MTKVKMPKLYKQVKKEADAKFETKTSIYKSSWIIREYKKRGGEFEGPKPKKSGLKRWYKENWVDLKRPIRNSVGKIIGYHKCGRKSVKSKDKSKDKNKHNGNGNDIAYPLCRPSKKITSKTPRTYKEISKQSITKAKREKKGKEYIQFGGKYSPKEFNKLVNLLKRVNIV